MPIEIARFEREQVELPIKKIEIVSRNSGGYRLRVVKKKDVDNFGFNWMPGGTDYGSEEYSMFSLGRSDIEDFRDALTAMLAQQ